LNDVPGFIDNEPKSRAFVEKGQAILPGVIVDATLAEARDLPIAHQTLNARGLDPQAFADDRCIDLEGAIFKFDCRHR